VLLAYAIILPDSGYMDQVGSAAVKLNQQVELLDINFSHIAFSLASFEG
jgi:hypothetical protein